MPFDILVKMWDCIIIEKWRAVMKFALGILKSVKEEIKGLSLDEMSTFIRYFQRSNDLNAKLIFKLSE